MKRSFWIAAFVLMTAIASGCRREAPTEYADLVLLHGKIVTMNPQQPEVKAAAVKGEHILALGSDKEIKAYIGVETNVVDLKGRLAVPGLIDAHGHFMSLGESLMGIDLKPTRSWEEIIDLVDAAVRQAAPGDWIVGRGWHQDKWKNAPTPNIEGFPLHDRLSEKSPDNPVLLIHVSGHGVFVNARGLEASGIDKTTTDPPGGEILRDADGNPTGMLRENAQDRARQALARYRAQRPKDEVEAEMRRMVKLAAEEAVSNGITSFHDMGETFETIDFFKKLADEGEFPLRLYVCVDEPSGKMKEKLADYRMVGYGKGFLTVRTIGERVLDGALGTHGGWLLEPYSDLPRSSGFNVIPVEEMRRSAELAVKHDYQMAIQGIGDRATRELLNIYSDMFARNPEKKDLRWRIEHCQVIHPDDLARFAGLGVIASVRGIFATSDGPWVVNRLGEERTRERGYQYQSMLNAGIVVINGTDPPVEDIDPVDNFYRTVTRKMENGDVFLPDQRLTREQALRTYTTSAAYAAFEEDVKGSLEPGKLADITVFSRDLMTVPEDEIPDVEVVTTIIGGRIKYRK